MEVYIKGRRFVSGGI